MHRHLNLEVGERVLIDGDEHRFDGYFLGGDPNDSARGLKFVRFRTNEPVLFTQQEFDTAYCEGRLRWLRAYERVEDVAPEQGDRDEPNAHRRQLWCEAFDADPTSNSTAALREFILKTAPSIPDDHPPSPGALRRWLKRGAPGDRRPRFMRDRHRRGPQAMRIHEIAQRAIAEKAEAYSDSVRVNQEAVYIAVRAALKTINTERRRDGLEPVRPPSKATVHRFLRRHLDYAAATRRYGARVAARAFAPIKGMLEARHILDVAIIDHTQIDCAVVDDEELTFAGRPYLTVLIDACSRSPLGFYLGFEPPSVTTAMACLRHALKPKSEIAQDYPDISGSWLGWGKPDTIICDNAREFTGSSFPDACADAGISLVYAPVGAPEYKGIGERFFGTLNSMLFHRLPGGLPFTPQARKEFGIDPAKDAVLLLSDLRRLIYQCIIEVYCRSFHKGIKASPEEVWRKQAAKHGSPYVADLKALDLALAKLAPERVLTREGISLHGLTYRAVEPLTELLADLVPRAKPRKNRWGTATVKVKYHPEDLGQVHVWNEVKQHYVTLPCIQPRYALGLSEYRHLTLKRLAREKEWAFQSEDERCLAAARLQDTIRAMIPVGKVVERRQAQRLKANQPPILPGDVVLTRFVEEADDLVPMATFSNRQDGATPRRPPRPQQARTCKAANGAASRRRKKSADELDLLTSLSAPEFDPFAGTDFGLLQDQARQTLGHLQ